MTLLSSDPATATRVGDLITSMATAPLPFRITAYDDSQAGPENAEVAFHIASPEGLRYLLTAPGDLGAARAYLTGGLHVSGIHPADPYAAFKALKTARFRHPTAGETARIVRAHGRGMLLPPTPPALESPPRWRRHLEKVLDPSGRRAEAISHHYDVGNSFYEKVLGPSMAYTCAVYTDPSDTLEAAQERKFELVCRKLRLEPGMRLLDVGCGWGSMVRHAVRHHGVQALGVTLSGEQAEWAQARIEAEGLSDRAEVRYLDYREVPPGEFDAISSIGLLEHVGVDNYDSYFGFLFERLRPGGRMLNHCITRPNDATSHRPDAFIDRYIFPDGELASPGEIICRAHDAGFELHHEENLRMSYARTLTAWCANLRQHWDACVADVGEPMAKLWGLYMAGSRLGFELNWIQLHQVLLSRPFADGTTAYPLRPDWEG
ncbi:class I SAM-dependent methyltransferase [Mobilicoccus massiliensis]|uniref:class I SAM-dependent methyltransferase n=1 Tax=Mobilicoccus massiliensis TaxID=1522310 RepID=UPI00058C21DB|nr:class I SAM-dependent methyltransferase [Mobilicoccus massiliensis]